MRRLQAVLLVVVAAACGGGGDAATAPRNPPPTGNPPPPGPSQVGVTVQDFAFAPTTVMVKVGSTVVWSNGGATAHTVTADGGSFDSGQLASSTGTDPYGNMTSGGTFSRAFNTVGTFSYHCANHTYMTGTIVVTQ